MFHWLVDFWTSVAGYLALIYTFVAIICVVQLFRIYVNRFLVLSYQGGFLSLSLLWSVIRVLFLVSLIVSDTPPSLVISLYWVPLCLQFATFSLYLLFYMESVHVNGWVKIGRFFHLTYLGINLLYVVIVSANIMAQGLDWGNQNIWDKLREGLSATLFFIIAVLFLIYGILVGITVDTNSARFSKNNKVKVATTTLFLFLAFTSRCVFDFLTATTAISVSLSPLGVSGLLLFSLMLLWEICPVLMILFVFRRIPSADSKRILWLLKGDFRRASSMRNLFGSPVDDFVEGLDDDEYFLSAGNATVDTMSTRSMAFSYAAEEDSWAEDVAASYRRRMEADLENEQREYTGAFATHEYNDEYPDEEGEEQWNSERAGEMTPVLQGNS